MSVDMFMKLGDLKGESRDDKHKNEIEVLSWSWGMSQSGSSHFGSGAGSGKVSIQDLSFTKYVDKATPDMMLACCQGKSIDEAKLTVRKAGGNPLEYIILTMKEVIITSISTGGSGGEDRLTESVTLNFAKVQVEYTEQNEKGQAGEKPKMGWSINENKKL